MNMISLVTRLECAELNYEEALRMVPKNKEDKHRKDSLMKYWQGQIDAFELVFKDIREGK